MLRTCGVMFVVCLLAGILAGCGGESEVGNPTFVIMPGVAGTPTVAYNSVGGEYMVVARSGTSIYGHRVATNGTLLDTRFPIVSGPNLAGGPAMAYDPSRNRYLVVWRKSTSAYLEGLFLTATGTPGSAFTILASNAVADVAVTYNATADEYLVCWKDSSIHARPVNADGSGVGTLFSVGGGATSATPAVTANPTSNEYLVVWRDSASGLVGQRVAGGGGTSGSQIAITAGLPESNDVAYSPTANTYLACWIDSSLGNPDVYTRVVDAAGALPGAQQTLSNHPSAEYRVNLGFCAGNSHYLASWVRSATLLAQSATATGTATGTLLTVDAGTSSEAVAASTATAAALCVYEKFGDIRGRVVPVF